MLDGRPLSRVRARRVQASRRTSDQRPSQARATRSRLVLLPRVLRVRVLSSRPVKALGQRALAAGASCCTYEPPRPLGGGAWLLPTFFLARVQSCGLQSILPRPSQPGHPSIQQSKPAVYLQHLYVQPRVRVPRPPKLSDRVANVDAGYEAPWYRVLRAHPVAHARYSSPVIGSVPGWNAILGPVGSTVSRCTVHGRPWSPARHSRHTQPSSLGTPFPTLPLPARNMRTSLTGAPTCAGAVHARG